MEQPLVSILMTSYNRESYIAEAIESVIKSTYFNFELIISDDCSSDNTVAIARKYALEDGRVKVFINDSNLQDYPNRNKAASYAKGKYIKYLDSDDAIYEDGLAYCVNAMERFPHAGMGIQFFQKEHSGENPVCWEAAKITRHQFFVRGCLNVGPSGTIFRRDVFELLGGFDTRFGVASDNFFNILLASKYPVVLLPNTFFFYRVHGGQERLNKRGYLKYNHLYLKELAENVSLPLSSDELKKIKRRVEISFLKQMLKYLWETKSVPAVFRLLKETSFSFKSAFSVLLLNR